MTVKYKYNEIYKTFCKFEKILNVIFYFSFRLSHNHIGIQHQKQDNKRHLPIEDPGLLEDVAQVDVGVQEVGIQADCLLEMVDRQPDLPLRVKHAPQITPSDCKIRSSFYGL